MDTNNFQFYIDGIIVPSVSRVSINIHFEFIYTKYISVAYRYQADLAPGQHNVSVYAYYDYGLASTVYLSQMVLSAEIV